MLEMNLRVQLLFEVSLNLKVKLEMEVEVKEVEIMPEIQLESMSPKNWNCLKVRFLQNENMLLEMNLRVQLLFEVSLNLKVKIEMKVEVKEVEIMLEIQSVKTNLKKLERRS